MSRRHTVDGLLTPLAAYLACAREHCALALKVEKQGGRGAEGYGEAVPLGSGDGDCRAVREAGGAVAVQSFMPISAKRNPAGVFVKVKISSPQMMK